MAADIRVVALDHVNVTTPPDLERETLDWYSSCLGLGRIPKPEGTRPAGAWFSVGDSELHVSVDEGVISKTAHFAVRVDDYPRVVEALRAAGTRLEQATVIPGRDRCFTFDPAGNRIELIAAEGEI